jgi:HEAT repeat protein
MKKLAAALLAMTVNAGWSFDWQGKIDADAERLKSDDAKERAAAVSDLASYDPSLAAPHLLGALRDDDKTVRADAARALGRGAVLKAVPIMIEWLADPNADVRATAAEVLGDIGGDDATAALIRTLGDADANVRVRAVVGLGKIGLRGNSTVVVPLISRLDDDKPEVKKRAIEQLKALRDTRAVIPLVARFGDNSLDVKKAAIDAIGVLGDRAAVSALIRLLRDPAEEIRSLAVTALGSIGAPEAIDALIDLLPAGTPTFKKKVAFAIGQIAGHPQASGDATQRAVRALVEGLATPEQREASREALKAAGKAAVPALIAHLAGKLPGDPATAVALLEDEGDPRATDALVAELERGRVAVPAVLAALGATGDPDALVPVLGTLSSNEPAVRLAAMKALRPLVGQDPRAADVLIERLADADLEVRILAAEYLGLTRARAAVDKLVALTEAGTPPRLRRAAIDALGEIGDRRAANALIGLLKEGPVELHRAAVDALSYVADPKTRDALIALIRDDRGPTRHHAVRALGAVLRAEPDERGEKLLRDLTDNAGAPVSVAAIAALAAADSKRSTRTLIQLVERSGSDRRRAAATALGDLGATDAVPALVAALSAKDDRVVADAAWALGEIASRSGAVATITRGDNLDVLFRVAKRGGWAASISATGALARIAAADPAAFSARRAAASALLFHRSRLVRINAARLVAEVERSTPKVDETALTTLVEILDGDPSTGARIAAARALGTIAGGKTARIGGAGVRALDDAAKERDADLGAAAAAAKKAAPAYPARTEWRTFYVVDPSADDRPVRQEPYFVVGGDAIVWATYTDPRGELSTEHFPAGDAIILPASREAEL